MSCILASVFMWVVVHMDNQFWEIILLLTLITISFPFLHSIILMSCILASVFMWGVVYMHNQFWEIILLLTLITISFPFLHSIINDGNEWNVQCITTYVRD